MGSPEEAKHNEVLEERVIRREEKEGEAEERVFFDEVGVAPSGNLVFDLIKHHAAQVKLAKTAFAAGGDQTTKEQIKKLQAELSDMISHRRQSLLEKRAIRRGQF